MQSHYYFWNILFRCLDYFSMSRLYTHSIQWHASLLMMGFLKNINITNIVPECLYWRLLSNSAFLYLTPISHCQVLFSFVFWIYDLSVILYRQQPCIHLFYSSWYFVLLFLHYDLCFTIPSLVDKYVLWITNWTGWSQLNFSNICMV